MMTYLERENLVCEVADNFQQGMAMMESFDYDCVLLGEERVHGLSYGHYNKSIVSIREQKGECSAPGYSWVTLTFGRVKINDPLNAVLVSEHPEVSAPWTVVHRHFNLTIR